MNRLFALVLLAISTLLLNGCGTSLLAGTSVRSAKTIAKPPANVVVHMSVEEGGEPVTNLSSDNFKIYENGVLLDRTSAHVDLLPRRAAIGAHTVLLLDLSGDISESDLMRISRGAAHFVEKVTTTQPVTVLVFDGSAEPRTIGRFQQVEEAQDREVPDLTPFVTGDESRNLYGAIIEAIATLDDELSRLEHPVQIGTLVTLATGPDLAARKTERELYRAIDTTEHQFYSIQPADSEIPAINAFGQNGKLKYDTIDTLPLRMSDLGRQVRDAYLRHYLVSYCSPARGGKRDVKVVVTYTNEHGERRKGNVRTGFDAAGFKQGCGPTRPILQARKEAEKREQEAQKRAEAEAAQERREAQEAAQARQKQQRETEDLDEAEHQDEAEPKDEAEPTIPPAPDSLQRPVQEGPENDTEEGTPGQADSETQEGHDE